MAEYIEREAVLALADDFEMMLADGTDEIFFEYIPIDKVRSLPAASVRPVVLCKDCAHSRKGKQSLECEKHIYAWNNLNRWVNEDDFCSWGVKKEA